MTRGMGSTGCVTIVTVSVILMNMNLQHVMVQDDIGKCRLKRGYVTTKVNDPV
jgi:hypothetical protein